MLEAKEGVPEKSNEDRGQQNELWERSPGPYVK